MARRALCRACLTSSVVSQHDTTSDGGEQSGFGIRASTCTCVPLGNGGGTSKHGALAGEKQLGVSATAGMRRGGPWLYWDHWSSGYWHRYKMKSPYTRRGWHRGGSDTGKAGVAVGSSPSQTHGPSQPFSGQLPSKRIIPDS